MAPTAAIASLPTLTQRGARVALQAAERFALEQGAAMSIAIVDAHTHLLSFMRMDGAKMTSIGFAMDMAFTAAGNRVPTSACQEGSWPGSATASIGNGISGRFCTLGGGVPIIAPSGNGDIIGAIGCSTGNPQQDEAAARAGRDAVFALIHKEREDEERRLESERQAVLRLWKEKEEEVGSLREELGRGSKRIKLDDLPSGRRGSIRMSASGSPVRRVGVGGAPDTPPQAEDGEILPSFVGEVALSRA